MPCSEAQLAANRANSQKSSGPTSTSGKEASRRNGYKHGMTGEGIVIPEEDQEVVARLIKDLTADMKPRSPAGLILISQIATLSVREERCFQQESLALALRVRHAAEAFDEERIDRAHALFDGLAKDPWNNLRKLKKMPEGVDRLIRAWQELRASLCLDPEPVWTDKHLVQAALMIAVKPELARGCRLGALSRGFWGDFAALGIGEGSGLDDEFRQAWAKDALLERIDAEIAALEAHRATLDFETIELDRSEAGGRALFDSSKEATLARRYEAEARRSLYRALKEFREVEAASMAKGDASLTSAPLAKMASSCQPGSPPYGAPTRPYIEPEYPPFPVTIMPDGKPLTMIRPEKAPG